MLEGEMGGSHGQVQVLLAEGTFHPCIRREGGGEAGGLGSADGWSSYPIAFIFPKKMGRQGEGGRGSR